jgi:hypothetical protein
MDNVINVDFEKRAIEKRFEEFRTLLADQGVILGASLTGEGDYSWAGFVIVGKGRSLQRRVLNFRTIKWAKLVDLLALDSGFGASRLGSICPAFACDSRDRKYGFGLSDSRHFLHRWVSEQPPLGPGHFGYRWTWRNGVYRLVPDKNFEI